MRVSLVPRERRFYELFDQQTEKIVAAAALLGGIHDAESAGREHVRINEYEHAGDEVTHEVARMINRTFVTPFDREDIYALSSGLDDLLDFADEVADTVALYNVHILPPAFTELCDLFHQSARQLQQAVAKLETQGGLEEHWVEVHRLENRGDDVSRHAIAALFDGSVEPLEVVKLKDIYGLLEQALDRCEDVANVLESITIKNA